MIYIDSGLDADPIDQELNGITVLGEHECEFIRTTTDQSENGDVQFCLKYLGDL